MASNVSTAVRIGLLWRDEWDHPHQEPPLVETCRLRDVFAAFAALWVAAEPVVYSDNQVERARKQLPSSAANRTSQTAGRWSSSPSSNGSVKG
jgi:hypothetical protein